MHSVLQKHCPRLVWGKSRTAQCVADESYIPTLLAALGLENQTTCQKGPTVTFASKQYVHLSLLVLILRPNITS
jgi:hypothetical protein